MSHPQLLKFIHHYIDQHQPRFSALSDSIWDHPETRFTETYSANLLADALEQEGFTLERGVGGIETAFIASYGSGHPVIALLGEYDALAGLSQRSGCATPQPLVENGNGHGCGHNLLGTAALAFRRHSSWRPSFRKPVRLCTAFTKPASGGSRPSATTTSRLRRISLIFRENSTGTASSWPWCAGSAPR